MRINLPADPTEVIETLQFAMQVVGMTSSTKRNDYTNLLQDMLAEVLKECSKEEEKKMTPEQETRTALRNKITRKLGYSAASLDSYLELLTLPDVIDLTEEYVRAIRLGRQS